MCLVLDQEYFDLRNCDIYNDFCEYASKELVGLYEGKLDYAYRFEATSAERSIAAEEFCDASAYKHLEWWSNGRTKEHPYSKACVVSERNAF